MAASAAANAPPRRPFTIPTTRNPRTGCGRSRDGRVVVARLARQQHPRDAALVEHDTRLDRLDAALAGGLEHVFDRLVHPKLLQVADRREHEQQLVALVSVERVLRPQPAQIDALLAVAPRVGPFGSTRHEEPRVETDLHLRGCDPARPRDQGRGVLEHEPGLLLGLTHGGCGCIAVTLVHGAAREYPGAAHEARSRVALDEQDLGAGSGVAHHDHRGRHARNRYGAGVELLAGARAVDLHRTDPTIVRRNGRPALYLRL